MRESSSTTGSQVVTDTYLSPGNDVAAVQTHTSSPPPYRRALVGADGTGSIHDVGASASELSTLWSWPAPNIPAALMDQAGTVFEARGGLGVVATRRDGSTVSYALPSAAAGVSSLNGGPVKGAPQTGGSVVSTFAPGPNGEVFGFVSNGVNSQIVGLNSRRQATLTPYGVILDAVTAASGQLEVLAYDPRLTTNDIVLLSIDPTALTVVQTLDTGVNARSGGAYLHTHALVATGSAVFLYLVLQSTPPSSVQETAHLLKVLPGSASASPIPVSNSAGLDITAGSDGRIYLYGGPGRNAVTEIDPVSGSTGVNPTLSSPDGSFVRALFI